MCCSVPHGRGSKSAKCHTTQYSCLSNTITMSADATKVYEPTLSAGASPPLSNRDTEHGRPFIVPIFLPHAGCPHRCAFCNQRNLIQEPGNEQVTPETLRDHVIEMLKYRSMRRHTTQIAFYGGNFLGLPKTDISRWLDAAGRCVDEKWVDSIRFSTRPDTIDAGRLNLMSAYPISTVEIGVQSMDDGVLTLSNRGHTAAHTVEAVRLLSEKPYRIGIQLMVGLPGDTEDINRHTGLQVCALRPDFVRVYPTLVLKNSRLASWYASGRYQPLSLEKAIRLAKTLLTLFRVHHIPVTRMGLQASEALDKRDAFWAGPYHPAFGHLVYSELFFDAVSAFIKSSVQTTADMSICVHPQSVSKLRGNKNQNVERLKKRFDVRKLRIATSPSVPIDAILINGGPLIKVFETPDIENKTVI